MWNVHGVNDVTQTEIHTAEPLVPELAIEKLKRQIIKYCSDPSRIV